MRTIVTFLILSLAGAQAESRIRLLDGREVTGDIRQLDGDQLVVRRSLDFGQAVERYPLKSIAVVEFAQSREIETVAMLPAGEARTNRLLALWESLKGFVKVPGSPTGRVGLITAAALAASEDRQKSGQALDILSLVEAGDHSPERRAEAFGARLLLLLKLNQTDEVREAAEAALALNPGADARIRAGASLALASLLREQLKALEKENPRWEIDPAVRPERNRLYHRTIELLLQPYLETGSLTNPVAKSLWQLVEFHLETGSNEEAHSVARDIAEIYPSTPESISAKNLMKQNENKP